MPSDQPITDERAMSLGEHLDDLRRRLMWALLPPLPLVILIFLFSKSLILWLSEPVIEVLREQGLPPTLHQLWVIEFVGLQLKLSLIGALVISGPWIIWQAWLFVRPGLFTHERRFARLLVPLSAIMTLAGTALTFWVLLPLMLTVLVSLGTGVKAPTDSPVSAETVRAILARQETLLIRAVPPAAPEPNTAWLLWAEGKLQLYVALPARGGAGGVAGGEPGGASGAVVVTPVPPPDQPLITQTYQLSTYIDFVLMTLLGTVLAFQMPPVIMLLGWLHMASVQWLRRHRRHALFICAIAAAVITPSSDPFSLIVMMVPLYALYELSILLLILAPAKKVAAGTVFSLRRSEESIARGTNARPAEPPREKMDSDEEPAASAERGASTALFDEPRSREDEP